MFIHLLPNRIEVFTKNVGFKSYLKLVEATWKIAVIETSYIKFMVI